jgi:hypothetical protein
MVVINQILVYCLNILSPFIEKVINQIVYSTSTGLLNLPPTPRTRRSSSSSPSNRQLPRAARVSFVPPLISYNSTPSVLFVRQLRCVY